MKRNFTDTTSSLYSPFCLTSAHFLSFGLGSICLKVGYNSPAPHDFIPILQFTLWAKWLFLLLLLIRIEITRIEIIKIIKIEMKEKGFSHTTVFLWGCKSGVSNMQPANAFSVTPVRVVNKLKPPRDFIVRPLWTLGEKKFDTPILRLGSHCFACEFIRCCRYLSIVHAAPFLYTIQIKMSVFVGSHSSQQRKKKYQFLWS